MTIIAQVEKHLRSGKSLTAMQALRLFGTINLRDIIYLLIQRGMDIDSEWMYSSHSKKRYKVWWKA